MGCGCNNVNVYVPRTAANPVEREAVPERRQTDAEAGRSGTIFDTLGSFAAKHAGPPAGVETEAGPSSGGFASIFAGIPQGATGETGAPPASPPPNVFPTGLGKTLGRQEGGKRASLLGAISAFNRSRVAQAAGASEVAPTASWWDKFKSAGGSGSSAPVQAPSAQASGSGGWSAELRNAVSDAAAKDAMRTKIREAAAAAGQREIGVYKYNGSSWDFTTRFVSAAQFDTIARAASFMPISVDALDSFDAFVADALVGDILAQACNGWGTRFGYGGKGELPLHPSLPVAWRYLERSEFGKKWLNSPQGGCYSMGEAFQHYGSLYLGGVPAAFYEAMGLTYRPVP